MKQTTVLILALGMLASPALAQSTTAPKKAEAPKVTCGTAEQCQTELDRLKKQSEVQATAYQLVRNQRDQAQQALSDALLGNALRDKTGASSVPQ
jgi:hypothetical protein